MVQLTVQLPDDLAAQVLPMQQWLPTLLAFGLAGFRTPASQTVAEVTEFLAKGPTREQVLAFHVSDEAQSRLQRLLALNQAGLLGANEEAELTELGKLEAIIVQLKASLLAQRRPS
jgi:hypothetical protein